MMNHKMTKRLFFIAAWLAIIISSSTALAETGACTKPAVTLKLINFTDEAYNKLIGDYPFQTKKYWNQHIENNLLQLLRANSPDVIFSEMSSSAEHQYKLQYFIEYFDTCENMASAGGNPGASCYRVHGELYSHDACGMGSGSIKASSATGKDIFIALNNFVKNFGSFSNLIAHYEKSHIIPPRGPTLKANVNPQKVSPLEDERDLFIDAHLVNCKGEPVYDNKPNRFGVVTQPKDTRRGETIPAKQMNSIPHHNAWLISPDKNGNVRLKYTLTKGVDKGDESIKISACGIGSKAEESITILIDGLEISVKPQKTALKPGEKTSIAIEFSKVSAKGQKTPIPGKDIQLKIEGLKDGIVTPKEKATTDRNGRATLTYRAGQNDKSIRITASYQPQNFPDKAEGSAVITVQEGKGDLAIQINGTLNWTGEDKDKKGTITSNFTINGTMTLHEQKHAGDYENYEIENLQMTYSHHAQFHNKKTDKYCPYTLFLDVHGEGSAPVQKGRIVIRYPRESSRSSSRKQGELDLRLSSGPLPTKWKFGCGGNQTKDSTTSISVGVVDQKSPIVKNQQEFSGSRTFGITHFQGAFNLAVAPALSFTFNDNESKEISTFPFVPKELEKVITEAGGSIEQMRNLGIGINKEGSNGKLTWKIRKIRNRD